MGWNPYQAPGTSSDDPNAAAGGGWGAVGNGSSEPDAGGGWGPAGPGLIAGAYGANPAAPDPNAPWQNAPGVNQTMTADQWYASQGKTAPKQTSQDILGNLIDQLALQRSGDPADQAKAAQVAGQFQGLTAQQLQDAAAKIQPGMSGSQGISDLTTMANQKTQAANQAWRDQVAQQGWFKDFNASAIPGASNWRYDPTQGGWTNSRNALIDKYGTADPYEYAIKQGLAPAAGSAVQTSFGGTTRDTSAAPTYDPATAWAPAKAQSPDGSVTGTYGSQYWGSGGTLPTMAQHDAAQAQTAPAAAATPSVATPATGSSNTQDNPGSSVPESSTPAASAPVGTTVGQGQNQPGTDPTKPQDNATGQSQQSKTLNGGLISGWLS